MPSGLPHTGAGKLLPSSDKQSPKIKPQLLQISAIWKVCTSEYAVRHHCKDAVSVWVTEQLEPDMAVAVIEESVLAMWCSSIISNNCKVSDCIAACLKSSLDHMK